MRLDSACEKGNENINRAVWTALVLSVGSINAINGRLEVCNKREPDKAPSCCIVFYGKGYSGLFCCFRPLQNPSLRCWCDHDVEDCDFSSGKREFLVQNVDSNVGIP